MHLKIGPVIGTAGSLASLVAWHLYKRTLKPDLQGAWWSHLVTSILAAATVVFFVETIRSAARSQNEHLLNEQQTAGGFLPVFTAGKAPHPTAALDDIARTGVAPDYHIRLAPEGFYLWKGGEWHPSNHKELESIKGATVMIQDEGGRERVRTDVVDTLKSGGNNLIAET